MNPDEPSLLSLLDGGAKGYPTKDDCNPLPSVTDTWRRRQEPRPHPNRKMDQHGQTRQQMRSALALLSEQQGHLQRVKFPDKQHAGNPLSRLAAVKRRCYARHRSTPASECAASSTILPPETGFGRREPWGVRSIVNAVVHTPPPTFGNWAMLQSSTCSRHGPTPFADDEHGSSANSSGQQHERRRQSSIPPDRVSTASRNPPTPPHVARVTRQVEVVIIGRCRHPAADVDIQHHALGYHWPRMRTHWSTPCTHLCAF